MKTLLERFEAKLEKTDGCWNWTGGKNKNGYAQMSVYGHPQYVHRLAYEIYIGEIPQGKHILHHCDNPICCNPNHLFPGTDKDNSLDCKNKGRNNKGEKNGGSKLTVDDVIAIRKSNEAPKDIAPKYGVKPQAIYKIRSGARWKHIKEGVQNV
ncbi:MAG: HNH endonuclease signature motif containing protein [Candidatus Micrarchaeia archaeon]|jgi:hypothetical protein